MWSYSGKSTHDTDEQVSHFRVELKPGLIALYHDGLGSTEFQGGSREKASLREAREAEIAALGAIIDAGRDAGYRFVTASELMALERRITPRD